MFNCALFCALKFLPTGILSSSAKLRGPKERTQHKQVCQNVVSWLFVLILKINSRDLIETFIFNINIYLLDRVDPKGEKSIAGKTRMFQSGQKLILQ